MIVLHHLERSRSHRVAWMLEELGLDYELQAYARDPKTLLAPDSLRQVHPMGKSPVLTDGGLVLAESGAILQYLVDRHGGGRFAPPPGSPELVRYHYWMHFAEGTAMPYLVMALVFSRIESAPMPFFARPIARAIAGKVRAGFVAPNVERMLDHVEAELAARTHLCGEEFSAADVQMCFPLEAAQARWRGAAGRSRTAAYLESLRQRPAYRRAAERAGGFEPLA
jgi:glutathione S-transferase